METPRLHQSIASVLINRSPLHCWFKAFRKTEEEWDEARNLGTLCHKLLLGGRDIAVIDAKDWRTTAAKEARDAAIAAGKIPVLTQKLAIAHTLKDKVLAELLHRGILLTGESEKTVQWTTPGGVECEGTLDHWIKKSATIYDFKFTATSAAPESVARLMVNMGADIQAAAYTQWAETAFPELAGRITFLFVYVEVDAPHAISVVKPDGEMRRLGESKWGRACDKWRECLEEYGTEKPWPAYSSEVVEVAPPGWATAQEEAWWAIAERQESNAIA